MKTLKTTFLITIAFLFVFVLSACGSSAAAATSEEPAIEAFSDSDKAHDNLYSTYDNIDNFIDATMDSAYVDAVDIYNSEIYGNTALESEVVAFLSEYLNTTLDDYNDELISRTECEIVLSTINKINDNLFIVSMELNEAYFHFELLSASKQNYEDGLEYLAEQDLESAIYAFSQVYDIDINYDDAQSKYQNALISYKSSIISAAQNSIQNNDFENAVFLLENAETILGFDEDLDAVKYSAYTAQAEAAIDAHLANNDFPAALNAYNEALYNSYIIFSDDTHQLIYDSQERYRDDVIAQSIDVYFDEGYGSAISTINAGLDTLPSDPELTKYLDLYYSSMPKELFDIQQLEGDSYSSGPVEDYYGETHYGTYRFYVNGLVGTTTQTYYPNKQYRKISGNYFAKCSNDHGILSFKIIADGITIYETDPFTEKEKTAFFELDISGVETLEFECEVIDFYGAGNVPTLYLTNVILENELTEKDLRK